MKYFTIKEFETSKTASDNKIENSIPKDKIKNWEYLTEKVLDPIREEYGKPIRVNSGYRCKQLNTRLKGSATSQHLGENAAAADITGGSPEENKKIFDIAKQLMQEGKIEFDQLIDENKLQWVHIGIKINRNQILYL